MSLVAIVLVSVNVPSVSGFRLLDHALCKEIDRTTQTCKQRTGEFLATDEWAYLWFKGRFDTSDVGAKYEMKIYDPDGNLFAPKLGQAMKDGIWVFRKDYPGEPRVMEAGDVVGWMGISITMNTAHFYINSTAISVSYSFFVPNAGVPPLELGEWRADFTLDSKIAVSQRFSIVKTTPTTTITPATVAPTTVTRPVVTETETGPGAAGLPSNLLLIGAVAAIVALVGVYVCMRRKKPVPMVEPATGEVSPSSMTSGEAGRNDAHTYDYADHSIRERLQL